MYSIITLIYIYIQVKQQRTEDTIDAKDNDKANIKAHREEAVVQVPM